MVDEEGHHGKKSPSTVARKSVSNLRASRTSFKKKKLYSREPLRDFT